MVRALKKALHIGALARTVLDQSGKPLKRMVEPPVPMGKWKINSLAKWLASQSSGTLTNRRP